MDRVAARATLGLDSEHPLLLSVGHMTERKGFHLLVRALKLLTSHSGQCARLALVGAAGEEGNFERELRSEVRRAGIDGRVIMPGAVSPEQLRLWYSSADLFCLASSREGWPNVLLEAMACGCPVVAASVWGVPEVIQDPSSGILVERSPEALAVGIDEGLTQEWDRDAVLAYGKSRSWGKTASECMAVYEARLVKGSR